MQISIARSIVITKVIPQNKYWRCIEAHDFWELIQRLSRNSIDIIITATNAVWDTQEGKKKVRIVLHRWFRYEEEDKQNKSACYNQYTIDSMNNQDDSAGVRVYEPG